MSQMSTEPTTVGRKLEGKVAIITGGASGIGEATARCFADQGALGIVIADIQDDLGKQVADSIGSNQCTYIHCDVTDEDQVKSLVESTVQIYGQLDIMFSNAGIVNHSDQMIIDLDFLQFDKLFMINVRGMAACVKHAARAMVNKGVKGSIVCTSSIAGNMGVTQWTDYSMSKHAVNGLVRCASKQLGEHGIRVNGVSPFTLATPLMCNVHQADASQVEEMYGPHASLKGIVLKVKHVVDAVLFLASGDSAFVTGHDLVVDGGVTV